MQFYLVCILWSYFYLKVSAFLLVKEKQRITEIYFLDYKENEVKINTKKIFAFPLLKHCYLESKWLWYQSFELVKI